MLLERRQLPRYRVDVPAAATLDSVVTATLLNASETGLAVSTPYAPVVNSVVPISLQLPDNRQPCDVRAQVVWSAPAGQIGLKLLKPEAFQAHFESWRAFTTSQQNDRSCNASSLGGAQEPNGGELGDDKEISDPVDGELFCEADIDPLRFAILDDSGDTGGSLVRNLALMAALAGCVLLGVSICVWYVRAKQSKTIASVVTGAPAENATVPAPNIPSLMPSAQGDAVSQTEAGALSTGSAAQSRGEIGQSSRPSVPAQHSSRHPVPPHTRIVIKLNRPTPVTPKLLHNPERIYFDFKPGTRAEFSHGQGTLHQSALVRRMRIGRSHGITRIVLDLRQPCQYRAKLSPNRPYKLTIDFRPITIGARS